MKSERASRVRSSLRDLRREWLACLPGSELPGQLSYVPSGRSVGRPFAPSIRHLGRFCPGRFLDILDGNANSHIAEATEGALRWNSYAHC